MKFVLLMPISQNQYFQVLTHFGLITSHISTRWLGISQMIIQIKVHWQQIIMPCLLSWIHTNSRSVFFFFFCTTLKHMHVFIFWPKNENTHVKDQWNNYWIVSMNPTFVSTLTKCVRKKYNLQWCLFFYQDDKAKCIAGKKMKMKKNEKKKKQI